MPQRFWYVRNCSLFERLGPEPLARLERVARIRKFPRDSAVYLPSDPLEGAFLLAEGRIRICSTTPEGKRAILTFIEPGELFGELALIQTGVREDRAEAVVASTVVFLPGAELMQLMESSAPLTLGVSKLIGLRRMRIERRLRSLLFRSNRDRLTHLLWELVQHYGQSTAVGIRLDIRLSHQEMASIIGATRETVTVLLGEMQLEKLLKVSRQQVLVTNPDLLAQLAGEVPETPLATGQTAALAKAYLRKSQIQPAENG